jgi:hypothetical protein
MDIKVSIPLFTWPLIFAFLFLIGMNGCTESGPTISVEKVEKREIEFPPEPGKDYPVSRINHPYFDENNQLHWNNDKKNPHICTCMISPVLVRYHEVILVKPRVDLCGCQNQSLSSSKLIGLDEQERIVWQRELIKGTSYKRVKGATPQAIVLSTLEVIEPKTGTVLEPLITGPKGPPKYGFYSAAATFRRKTKDFILFDAEYSLFSTQGGLYLFNPKQEVKTLIKKGQQSLHHLLKIRNIALSEDERFAFLAQLWEARGPEHAEFVIFDLEKKRTVFKERLDNNCSHPDAIIVVGKNGHLAMSYDCKRKHIIVHYRILPNKGETKI